MIYLASDHGGYELKSKLKDQISKLRYETSDCGNDHLDLEDDFVDFASKAASKMKDNDRGIFLCRNGVGVDIVANRYSHVRSILGFDEKQVEKARTDDDVNVLCLPADYIDADKAWQLVQVFLNTKFSGEERFIRRLEKIKGLIVN